MIVFAETNFVLELAFGRDKFARCRDFIDMAEKGEIVLSLPAYSFVEPYEVIIRRRKSRAQVHELLLREAKEITRTAQFEQSANQLAQLTGLLIQVGESEQDELRKIISQLLDVASVIDLNPAILRQALTFQDDVGLSPQDSVVFAAILAELEKRGGPACFVTTNSKDFSAPGIAEALEPYDCKLLFDFKNGLNYVRSQLGQAQP